jgi:hypothetical protein
MNFPQDVARLRLDNALLLFEEFVQATVKYPDAATLRGLERRFAERIQIQPSYWSQIKGRSRQIGERLARQFERLSRKPIGWMDQPHRGPLAEPPLQHHTAAEPAPAVALDLAPIEGLPGDDDERFIVGLVLSFYRRHPERARTQLLALLGEALVPAPRAAAGVAPELAALTAQGVYRPAKVQPGMADVDAQALWHSVRRGVAPLKKKR